MNIDASEAFWSSFVTHNSRDEENGLILKNYILQYFPFKVEAN